MQSTSLALGERRDRGEKHERDGQKHARSVLEGTHWPLQEALMQQGSSRKSSETGRGAREASEADGSKRGHGQWMEERKEVRKESGYYSNRESTHDSTSSDATTFRESHTTEKQNEIREENWGKSVIEGKRRMKNEANLLHMREISFLNDPTKIRRLPRGEQKRPQNIRSRTSGEKRTLRKSRFTRTLPPGEIIRKVNGKQR